MQICPEIQLILMSACLMPSPSILNHAKHILKLPLEWEYIVSVAKKWGVSAYVFHFCTINDCRSYLPRKYWKIFQDLYQRQALQTIYLKRQLHDIKNLFTQNNIDFCFIKGAELIETVYANTPVRSMSDIDMLCHPEDIDKIITTLVQAGYFQKTMHQSKELQDIATYRKHFPAFFHANRHTIEIHFNLFPGVFHQEPLTRKLWDNAHVIKESNQYRLHPDHHLLYLCHHLSYHIQSPREGMVLYWFFDIYQCLTDNKIPIACPLLECMDIKNKKQIEHILSLVYNQWCVSDTLINNKDTGIVHIINKTTQEGRAGKAKRVLSYYWQLWFDKNPQWSYCERLSYWFHLIFPNSQYLMDRYHIHNKWLLPVYYIAHPFGIILRAIRRLT